MSDKPLYFVVTQNPHTKKLMVLKDGDHVATWDTAHDATMAASAHPTGVWGFQVCLFGYEPGVTYFADSSGPTGSPQK